MFSSRTVHTSVSVCGDISHSDPQSLPLPKAPPVTGWLTSLPGGACFQPGTGLLISAPTSSSGKKLFPILLPALKKPHGDFTACSDKGRSAEHTPFC